ncbi:putative 50 kda protein in type i retrotransposable element r1dm, partial [Lasius niger]
MEVSAVLINLLDERSTTANLSPGDVKKAVAEMLDDLGGLRISGGETRSEMRVSRGPTVEISDTTSFLVIQKENARDKFASSQVTRETLYKVLKPADCGLRVKLSRARDCRVRIETFAPDIEKIRTHSGLVSAGLEVRENTKLNPRLIVHGVSAEMSAEEIKDKLIAQNLSGDSEKDLKITYIFTSKHDKRTTSCIMEVPSA